MASTRILPKTPFVNYDCDVINKKKNKGDGFRHSSRNLKEGSSNAREG